jgi:hypothetical protein
METFGLTHPPHKEKVYIMFERLRNAHTPNPEQIAIAALQHILTPPPPPKQTKKQQLEADAKAKSKARLLKLIRREQS